MSDIRCHKLDYLANQIIDMYRQLEDLVASRHSLVELSRINRAIELLHQTISEHRTVCTFCIGRSMTSGKRKPTIVLEEKTLP